MIKPGDIVKVRGGRALLIAGNATRTSNNWKRDKLREVWGYSTALRRKFWVAEHRLEPTGFNIHTNDPSGGI
jgi:hypothetical protein